MRFQRLCTVTFVLLLAGAAASAQTQDLRQQIDFQTQKFMKAAAASDAAGVAALYTADAQLFPPNYVRVDGREAIQEFWQGVFTDSGATQFELTTVELTPAGDFAIETGTYKLGHQSGKPLDRGKYIVVWKREGGQWKLHRDIWNSDLLPKPAPSAD